MLQVDVEKTPFYQMGTKKGEAWGEKNASFKMDAQTIAKEFGIDYDQLLKYIKQERQS